MWQMEVQTFVAITCHATLSAALRLRPISSTKGGMFGRIRAALSAWPPAFTLQTSTFACLLSLEERAGMRGMQASGLPVYSEGFLHCSPPASFEGFFTFLCWLLFWEQVMGSAHGSLLNSSISVWSGSAGILSYRTYCSCLMRGYKLYSISECHHLIPFYWAETW